MTHEKAGSLHDRDVRRSYSISSILLSLYDHPRGITLILKYSHHETKRKEKSGARLGRAAACFCRTSGAKRYDIRSNLASERGDAIEMDWRAPHASYA